MSFELSLETLKLLNKKYRNKPFNEANTRFQIIDKIITKTLFWPTNNVVMEEHTNEGFTDYQLKDNNKTYLVIEAKNTKVEFNFSQYKKVINHRIAVKVLMQDANTKKAITQVKNYCNDIGCKYACITNGHEWAFFKTYIDGKSWQDGSAFVIFSLEDFIDNFAYISKHITYDAIVKEYSFNTFFEGIEYSSNERYEPKLQIHGYNEHIANNHIEFLLSGYFTKYFGEIRETDRELLEKCYVSDRGYSVNFNKVTHILEDALSPYMEQNTKLLNIEKINETDDTFNEKIKKIIINEKKAKVLVLFGGKGAGKTTFLVNLFNNNQNSSLRAHSIIGYVNLLKVANDKEAIKNEILNQLLVCIDKDKLLENTNDILEKLFEDKFSIELKQSLNGLDKFTETYIIKRNDILQEYKKDKMYTLSRLATYWRKKRKAIIINIDNTDQFDQSLQDYCFSFANELSEKLLCISIISLREERYVRSAISGYLDAYEQNGFHISSPNPQQVFLKRLEFIQDKINQEKIISDNSIGNINILFKILETNLKNKNSVFNKFMTAATHGNIRQGLELFKYFLFSNYTNVTEMIKQGNWDINLHQIIKPIMTPTYRFYDEKMSTSIPNIYRLRSEYNSSHFTAYRILYKLSIRNDEYISLNELKSYFIDTFNMENDFELNLSMLLSRGFIESENGAEEYKYLDRIKISSFGYYMQDTIFKDFAYLDLISTDISLVTLATSNSIINQANKEYQLIKDGQNKNISEEQSNALRYKRLLVRVEKVHILLEYLLKQEEYEVQCYSLPVSGLITKKILDNFAFQKNKALQSAQRTLHIKQETLTNKNGIKKL